MRASQKRGPGPAWWQQDHRRIQETTPQGQAIQKFIVPQAPSVFTTPFLAFALAIHLLSLGLTAETRIAPG